MEIINLDQHIESPLGYLDGIEWPLATTWLQNGLSKVLSKFRIKRIVFEDG
jgi:hypothetical protein